VTDPIVLDSGPLGRLTHPRPSAELVSWLLRLANAGRTVIVPEIADYKVRRSLLLHRLHASITRLDALQARTLYLPITTRTMRRAAELWADVRQRGQPTADSKALDADVILAAQAEEVGGIVATDNIDHLSRFVDAREWRDIDSATLGRVRLGDPHRHRRH
jgi:predicted nucleic acid-binding protein